MVIDLDVPRYTVLTRNRAQVHIVVLVNIDRLSVQVYYMHVLCFSINGKIEDAYHVFGSLSHLSDAVSKFSASIEQVKVTVRLDINKAVVNDYFFNVTDQTVVCRF